MDLDNKNVKKKYDKAIKSLAKLKEALTGLQTVPHIAQCAQQDQQTVYKIYRDSLIQRFEYTFDTTWKYLSEYLQSHGYAIAIKSPKVIFREGLKAKILSADEVRLAIEMIDDRNLTTHGYDEELIETISSKISAYALLLEATLERTKI